MKTRYKSLILIVIIIISVLAFYSYKRKQYLTLNLEDKQIIQKSFNIDSNGKGYSDEGQKLLEEDDKLMTTLSSEDKRKFLNLYSNEMKLIRIVVLSKDKEEFLNNLKKFYINRYCVDSYLVDSKSPTKKYHFVDKFGVGESEETIDYFYILKNKYLSTLEYKEVSEIINPTMTDQDCSVLGDIKL